MNDHSTIEDGERVWCDLFIALLPLPNKELIKDRMRTRERGRDDCVDFSAITAAIARD